VASKSLDFSLRESLTFSESQLFSADERKLDDILVLVVFNEYTFLKRFECFDHKLNPTLRR
jgi:hypothetical protein